MKMHFKVNLRRAGFIQQNLGTAGLFGSWEFPCGHLKTRSFLNRKLFLKETTCKGTNINSLAHSSSSSFVCFVHQEFVRQMSGLQNIPKRLQAAPSESAGKTGSGAFLTQEFPAQGFLFPTITALGKLLFNLFH